MVAPNALKTSHKKHPMNYEQYNVRTLPLLDKLYYRAKAENQFHSCVFSMIPVRFFSEFSMIPTTTFSSFYRIPARLHSSIFSNNILEQVKRGILHIPNRVILSHFLQIHLLSTNNSGMCRICTYHYYFVFLYLFTPQIYHFFPNSPNFWQHFSINSPPSCPKQKTQDTDNNALTNFTNCRSFPF